MNTAEIETTHHWLSPNFINLEIFGSSCEMITIQIKNQSGESRISLLEEINSGKNQISIDLSSLVKGIYYLLVSDTKGHPKLEETIRL
jgi:hypothetical protein